ncbi:MAG: ABC transporter substrate-binding protein [Sulfolobales archaeon]
MIAVLIVAIIIVGTLYYYFMIYRKPPASIEHTVVIYASLSEMTTADPSTEFSNSVMWLPLVYETLLWYDPIKDTFIPGLAVSYESKSDGKIWIFHLRKNAVFHDGTPVTAYAVKASIERTIELGGGAAYIWDPVEKIETPDNYTVVFYLKYPAPLNKIAASPYATYIFSPRVVEYAGASKLTDPKVANWFNSGHDSGSGPYRLAKWDPENEVVLEKFNDWWGWKEPSYPLANPYAPDIFIIRIIKDATTQERLLRAAEIDIAQYVPPESIEDLKKDPKFVVEFKPSFQNLILLINTKKPPLDNILVRRAIAHAIPYNDIVSIARKGFARVASGVIPYGMWGHFEDLKYEYNLTQAKQLLAQAGYPNGISRPLILTYTAGDIYEQRTSELIKASLAQIGITIDIRPMSWEEQWALAKKGWEDPNASQDLLIFYWWPDVLSPITYLYNMFSSKSKDFNLCYYVNPEFDELINNAYSLEGSDPTKALELYRKAQEILYRDVPGIGLWDMTYYYVARNRIGNLDNAINPAYPTVVFAQALSVKR